MSRFFTLLFASTLVFVTPSLSKDDCGVMIMAHGGTPEWDQAVIESAQPVLDAMPATIAFGMANPHTLQEAITELESRSVPCINVVRLFVSGESFLHQTEYLLGLREDPPSFFITHGPGSHHGGHQAVPAPLKISVPINVSQEGLMDAPEMAGILKERALGLTNKSGKESILILAHGPGDDQENERWLKRLDALAEETRETGHFNVVRVETLREDWEEKRAEAEDRIHNYITTQAEKGERVLVIPFRLFGFGPYEEVLEGLPYHADGTGLLPSDLITQWLFKQISQLQEHNDAAIAGR